VETSRQTPAPIPEASVTDGPTFEPVPLPPWQPGRHQPGDFDRALRQWASSPPVRALADASGWRWPDCVDTQAFLDQLAEASADWDFRARQERDAIAGEPARVGERVIPERLIRAAADALGLVTSHPVPRRPFTHLVVLSGLVRACVNRTHYAAGLQQDMRADDLAPDSVTVLGAHRLLSQAELVQASDLGLDDRHDEADVVVAAVRRAFGLDWPPGVQQEEPPGLRARADLSAREKERLQAAWARYRWPAVDVVIAPSSEPAARRANTPDQLRYWADLAGIDSRHDVLLVTTQIYVPYQHMEALRVLGLERGCGVYSCGVDAARSLLPAKAFGGREYLQEVRSALRAAATLLEAERNRARELS
jgi:hypothetical protein